MLFISTLYQPYTDFVPTLCRLYVDSVPTKNYNNTIYTTAKTYKYLLIAVHRYILNINFSLNYLI